MLYGLSFQCTVLSADDLVVSELSCTSELSIAAKY